MLPYLGSAAAEGENRAQKAIEQALNSPLLNDNDIRGAKWILININSAEGDNEFTMDEVETIQNHLLSQAGENTDVILGLGYDNALENKIGITLIATGFEHKDPFDKKEAPKVEKKEEEKIVMVLQHPEDEKKKYRQPVFVFDEKKEEKPADEIPEEENIIEQKGFKSIKDEDVYASVTEQKIEKEMEPTIVEVPVSAHVNLPAKNDEITVDKSSENIVHFTLSSEPNSIPAEVNQHPPKKLKQLFLTINQIKIKKKLAPSQRQAVTWRSLRRFMQKLSQNLESKSVEEPTTPLPISKQEDEPVIGMQLVVKNSHEAEEEKEEPKVHQTMPIMMPSVEELPQVDETGDLKRRAMERIAKLRNLSFNVNATDPNNEFESVPAYLRRNMELHNSIADVESFYSNYTVKSDENNKAEISTINTFLEGKKPD